ncbi:MAG: RdgB/HAM1 family non-canonical purine NTP pyrophosphatase [Pirellula sp.]
MRNIADLLSSRSILLGTNNRKKIVELVNLLEPRGFELKTPADFAASLEVDETGQTFMENARIKAVSQAKHRGMWAVGEDSGLCVDALDGRPGIYSARFSGETATDQTNNELLLSLIKEVPLEKRSAHYVSTIVLADPDGGIHVESSGECYGRIIMEARGDQGFGYDPLFEIVELHRTFAELGLTVKRAISHRARALRGFLKRLDELIG